MMSDFSILFLTTNEELKTKVLNFIDDWKTEKEYIETNTSGSTGTPKTIRLQKKEMKASAQMSGEYFKFSSGKKIMLSLSIDTIGGKMIVVRALENKMTLVVSNLEKNPIRNLNESIYFISLVPYQLLTIIEETPKKLNLIDHVLLGGAPVSKKLKAQIQDLKPCFYESFGMTETMSHVAIKNLKSKNDSFEALGSTYFTLVNDSLVIHAPELNIQNLQTNDQVELVSNKQFKWLGRKDFVINSGGKKFHPELIEHKLENSIPFRFYIHKEFDRKLGEKIVLIIENETSENLKEEIFTICKNQLDKHEIPKNIYFIKLFVETNSGKINRIETYKKLKK